MGTNRKPMSGRAQDDYPSKLDTYNKASKTKATGRHMRTFSRTKTSTLVSAWDSDTYLHVMNSELYPLADATGAVDSVTTGSAQFLSWLDATWELFYTNANLKDLVAAEEASWKLYFCAAFFIKFAMQVQYTFRCYLPAYTESDIVPGGTTDIAYFSQSSFDIFLASMAQYPIPKGVNELINTLCSWIIQLAPEYEQFTLKLPGSFLYPWNSKYDLADLEAARELMRVNMGNAITHAKKFGLKMGTWSDPVKPIVKDLTDVDVIAYLNHANTLYYDKANSVTLSQNGGFIGANSAANWTGTEYMFKDNPNESDLHVLAPIFGTYDATHNKYGGWAIEVISAAEYAVSGSKVAQHGTNITGFNISTISGKYVIMLFKGWTDNAIADGELNIMVSGTEVTADKGMDDSWPMTIFNKLFKGTNRGMTEANNDLINYLGRLLT